MRHPPFSHNLKVATLALENVIKGHSLNGKTFLPAVHYLLYETLRDFAWGDFHLKHLLHQPLKNQRIRALLLIALTFLKNNPQRAFMLVDQAVGLAKQLAPKTAGLCNAVLRQFLREESNLPLNQEAQFKHPQWWIETLQNDYPKQWQEILQAGNRAAPMTLRINPLKTTKEHYQQLLIEKNFSLTVDFLNHSHHQAIFLENAVPSETLPFFEEGFVHIQDFGAQMALDFLKTMPFDHALDACAAPGGKSALWLENIPHLKLIALDKNPKRCAQLKTFLKHYQLQAQVQCQDCCTFESPKLFSAILADCPCTGSGVAGRHPDSKWLKKPSDIVQFAQMQQHILQSLWKNLAPNGKMLFATCSVFKTENEKNVQLFLKNNTNAVCLNQKTILPTSNNDGFFYALFLKK